MNVTRTATATLFSAVLLASCVASTNPNDRAKDALKASMERAFSLNVVAIKLQRSPEDDDSLWQIKVEQSRGKTHSTWLQPLNMAGYEQVDDGKVLRQYIPDLHWLVEEESPRKEGGDLRQRMERATRNYRFQFEPSTKIAGRQAVCVKARPRASDLGIRRFYLDAKTYFLLRLETENPGDMPVIHFDTIAISFPKDLPKSIFDLHPLGTTRNIHFDQLWKPGGPQPGLDFVPAIPKSLPHGFFVDETLVCIDPQVRSYAVHISDGLVKATVYEHRLSERKHQPGSARSNRSVIYVNGVQFLLVSDIPQSARGEILDAFKSEFEKLGNDNGLPKRWKDFSQTGRKQHLELNKRSKSLKSITAAEPPPSSRGWPSGAPRVAPATSSAGGHDPDWHTD